MIVAHDFPPVRSPQAIRATYFCKGLIDAGASVEVLTRSGTTGRAWQARAGESNALTIHRCSPGPFEQLIASIANRKPMATAMPAPAPALHLETPRGPFRLNWKGQLVAIARRTMDLIHFPDGRSAWVPAARAWLRNAAKQRSIDAAVLMHEPAAGVLLWEDVDALGIPWAVDLADPVLAPYTRLHWRKRALRLERDLVTHCHAASVTNAGTAELLARRHGLTHHDFRILPQGFVEYVPGNGAPQSELVLLYTGRFYGFRPAEPLIDAVIHAPGVQLHVAGPELPGCVIKASVRHPDRIRIIGEVSHEEGIRLQRMADVLVSVGNVGTAQTPGKVIEYFGAGRPILHLCNDASDPIPSLLSELRRGLACKAAKPDIVAQLSRLSSLKQAGTLDSNFDLRLQPVDAYSWAAIGQRLAGVVAGMIQSEASNS